jgi:hypothetical protein
MGVVNTTYTFTSTDTITSAKMNNIIDDTTFTSDAIQGTTLQVVSPGKLAVNAGGITSNELASNSVVTAKIADSNVTTAKIADSNVTTAKIADSNVTTAKIADSNVTTAKIADSSVTPAKLSQPLTLETAKATTSGTIVEFTGIPSWVKRITMIFDEVGTNGVNNLDLQIGSGSYVTSGYDTLCSYVGGSSSSVVAFGGGFGIVVGSNSGLCYGRYTLDLVGGNKYIGSGVFHVHQVGVAQYTMQSAGSSPVLSGPIDRIRIVVIGGANTFDSGSINIMYE